jgi:aspartyl-tRNA(Asn)/glutamyl-tRNA(Gln) amidotransferase subunit B
MRSKEEAYDYRYFPEPDLVPLEPSEQWVSEVQDSLPELPAARRAKVGQASGIAADQDAVVTVVRLELDRYVDAIVAAGGAEQTVAVGVRRLANEVAAEIDSLDNLVPAAFARLVAMESDGSLTPAQSRTVLKEMLESGGDPADIAKQHGFEAMGAGALEEVVERVVSEHPDEWARYAGGEDKLTGFFVGKIKEATGNNADLKQASALLRAKRGN